MALIISLILSVTTYLALLSAALPPRSRSTIPFQKALAITNATIMPCVSRQQITTHLKSASFCPNTTCSTGTSTRTQSKIVTTQFSSKTLSISTIPADWTPPTSSSSTTNVPSSKDLPHLQHPFPCGIASIDTETWQDLNVSSWLRLHLQKFRRDARNDTSKNFITDYMLPNFFEDVAPSQLQCNAMMQCSIGSCQNLNKNLDDETRRMAWYVIESISNFNNYLNLVHEAVQDTAINIAAQLEPLVRDFSSAGWESREIANEEVRGKLIMAAALGVSLVASAALPGIFAVRAGSEAFNAAMNAIPGTIAGIHASGNSFGANLFSSGFQDWVHDMEIGLARFFSHSLAEFEYTLKGPAGHILRGWYDEKGHDLASILSDGHFVHASQINPVQLSQLLMEYWMGLSVNFLWSSSRTYIVMSESRNCTNDSRGPSWSKVCLNEAPSKVFYVYYINKALENDHIVQQVAQVLAPPGFNYLIKGRSRWNLTLDKVVLSSYKYYQKFKHAPMGTLSGVSLGFDNLDPATSNIWTIGAGYRGIFTIPICRDDRGRFISSVAVDESRNYPCICGPSDGRNKSTWSFATDESAGFLHATGLRYSADFPTYCENNMGCGTEDESWHKHALADKYPKVNEKDEADIVKATSTWRDYTRYVLDWAYTQCPNWKAHTTQGSNGGPNIPVKKGGNNLQPENNNQTR